MVLSSISTPMTSLEATFPSVAFDHTYTKLPLGVPASPLDTSGAGLQGDMSTHNGGTTTNNNNQESDMLCDLDLGDLDFSLSDFAMDTESDMKNIFEDFVDTALCLSSSTEVTCASVCACSRTACVGRQNTVAVSCVCDGDSVSVSQAGRLEPAGPTGPEHRGERSMSNNENSPSLNAIPTKVCSCIDSESDGTASGLYSSCQSDETTLSSSTYGKTLRPGDYLPPLYIDTQNYGVTNCASRVSNFQDDLSPTHLSCLPSDENGNVKDNERQHFDNFVDSSHLLPSSAATSSAATATAMCEDSSCVLTPLSLPDFCFTDDRKSSEHQEQLSDSSFAETPSSSQFDDVIDDLDIESISDLEQYLSQANLDLTSLSFPSPNHSSLSNSDPTFRSQSHSGFHTKAQLLSDQEAGTKENYTDSTPVSGLRLSILDNFSSKLELTSWLDRYAVDGAFTPPSSPDLLPSWQGIPVSREDNKLSRKQDPNILDLFSDDNAHAFLSDDSAICQMQVSQFL